MPNLNRNIIVEFNCNKCNEIHEIKLETPIGFVDSILLAILGELSKERIIPTIFIVENGVKTDITIDAIKSSTLYAIQEMINSASFGGEIGLN